MVPKPEWIDSPPANHYVGSSVCYPISEIHQADIEALKIAQDKIKEAACGSEKDFLSFPGKFDSETVYRTCGENQLRAYTRFTAEAALCSDGRMMFFSGEKKAWVPVQKKSQPKPSSPSMAPSIAPQKPTPKNKETHESERKIAPDSGPKRVAYR